MIIGAILLTLRGFSAPLVALPVIGIVLFVVGYFWKPRKKPNNM